MRPRPRIDSPHAIPYDPRHALEATTAGDISRHFPWDDCDRGGARRYCYGIVKNIETFNPIRIAFHEWIAIIRDLFAARSAREAVGVIFGPPGWRADGQGLTSKNIRTGWEARHAR